VYNEFHLFMIFDFRFSIFDFVAGWALWASVVWVLVRNHKIWGSRLFRLSPKRVRIVCVKVSVGNRERIGCLLTIPGAVPIYRKSITLIHSRENPARSALKPLFYQSYYT
jgi:hypothetical protein